MPETFRRTHALVTLAALLISAPARAEKSPWSLHFQATVVPQGNIAFDAPYTGPHSVTPGSELETSVTSTLYLGRSIWKGGELYANPELTAGRGISNTQGIAGFPNGEIYRVGNPDPTLYLSRIFLRQTFDAGGEIEAVEDAPNQVATTRATERFVLTAGLFSLNDIFDDNAFAHNPREQFLNWTLMDNGAWDYAADTRGYTWGVVGEYYRGDYAIRLGFGLMPTVANGSNYDLNVLQANGENLEMERRFRLGGKPGKARLLAYVNQAHMGNYDEAIALAQTQGTVPDITATRAYRSKWGTGISMDQVITDDVGVFLRAGWSDGSDESFVFTEVERTLTFGVSVSGAPWSREPDVFGLGLVTNGISREHADYLAAGGLGFLLGDGALNYAPEQILESYYLFQANPHLALTADYQFVLHPGYNRDRGPVSILAARAHVRF